MHPYPFIASSWLIVCPPQCHVRVSTPGQARTLVSAFVDRPLVQTTGLDSAGSLPSPGGTGTGPKPISAELVDGEREALYWNKVPEKVRREAVRKAIAHASQTTRGEVVGGGEEHGRATAEEKGKQDKRPRKRRRKA